MKFNIPLIIIGAVVKLSIFFLIIFIAAGTTDYLQGWVFSITTLVLSIVLVILFKKRKGLIKERLKPGPGMKFWDKILLTFMIPSYIAIIIVAPIDAVRFQWSPEIHSSIYIISLFLFILAYFIITWAMWENEWFSSVVRIQKDRNQKVIESGPYKIVRHPGYVGGILIGTSSAILLGSLWALIPAGIMSLTLIIRTALEDKTLKKELEGYKDYTKKTKYRLIPWIW